MAGAVFHGTTAGLADVLGEGAAFGPGDHLVLAIRAGHATGGCEGDVAFATGERRGGGCLE